MKNYEVSVLLIEPDKIKKEKLEIILEYVGLSGRNVRDIVASEQEGVNCLRIKKYDIIIGDIPQGIQLPQEQIHVAIPKSLDVDGYIQFLSHLTKKLEEKFGFYCGGH